MILVDTSIWVDHFRGTVPRLVQELEAGSIVTHPFVIGELALGHLRHRGETLRLLENLNGLEVCAHNEVLQFVDEHELSASGIGWVDAHLLCAVQEAGASLWTNDVKLRKHAARLGLL